MPVVGCICSRESHSSHPDQLIRRELCQLLTQHPICATPANWALLALMLLQAARLDARLNEDAISFCSPSRIATAGISASSPKACARWSNPPAATTPPPTT
jgi:hypothetical protein